MEPLAVTLADIERAHEAIAGQVVRTPLLRSLTLSSLTGAEVWLKFENLQFTASFKDRGALWRLLQLAPDERARGVVAVSAGNHAQGVAYHAARLGIPATIVMPRYTPNMKVANTRALGADVVLSGADIGECRAEADRLSAEHGLTFIPPYDDPYIIAGQGTCAVEILQDAPDLDVLVVPIGGGGLIAGMAVAAHALRPGIELIGVQTQSYPSMVDAVRGTNHPVGGATIAEGIAVPQAGVLTAPIVRQLVRDVVMVTEPQLEQAVTLLLEIEKTVAEGAGAAGLAALLADPARFAGRKVAVVVTGGNIDLRILAMVIMRGLARSGRLSRFDVDISDVPGTLGRVTAIVGKLDGNIVEVAHQRLFSDLSVRNAVLELAVETRDTAHAEAIAAALTAAGYTVR